MSSRFSQYIESHDVKYLELFQSDCIINIRIFVFGPIWYFKYIRIRIRSRIWSRIYSYSYSVQNLIPNIFVFVFVYKRAFRIYSYSYSVQKKIFATLWRCPHLLYLTYLINSVAEEFSRMTSTRYTLEELSVEASLLPAHVDPSRLEDYLRDDEFIKVCWKHYEPYMV